MLPKNNNKLNELWNVVGRATPIIGGGNWKLLRDQWRHEVTYNLEHFDVVHGWVNDKVETWGYENVTLGQAWDADSMKPRPLDGYVGVYVRDIDLQVERFKEQMANVEPWEIWK